MRIYKIQNKVKNNKKRAPIKIGTKFSKFTIIEDNFYKDNYSNHLHVKCECSCGNKSYQRLDRISKRITKSCQNCSIYLKERNHRNLSEMTSKMLSILKTRSKTRGLDFNIDMEYLNNLYYKQNMKCKLSNIIININPINNDLKSITASLDRIDNSKGYIKGNVQWLHKRINIMKGNLNELDFIEICNLIAKSNQNNLQDNFDPSILNELLIFNSRVNMKEQRLIAEDSNQ